jgi:molecular chaperone GrpE
MTDETTTQSDDSATNLEAELAQMKDIAMRAMADLQNYKRKADEERTQLLTLGKLTILIELLPVLDNFKRAFSSTPEELKSNNWVSGIENIEKQFLNIVRNCGLEEIATIGQPVNPLLHEIVSAIPGEKDIILEELEKGYTLNGKVIRVAKVVVGSGS